MIRKIGHFRVTRVLIYDHKVLVRLANTFLFVFIINKVRAQFQNYVVTVKYNNK